MTTELMIDLLKQANTGTEMLNVLDALDIDNLSADRPVAQVLPSVDQFVEEVQSLLTPTLEEIAF